MELDYLTQEWAEKGEVTEQEARNFVDTLLNQLSNQRPSPPSTPSPASVATTPTQRSAGGSSGSCVEQAQTTPPEVQLELQELTAQIAAMRKELEQLWNQDSLLPLIVIPIFPTDQIANPIAQQEVTFF